METPFDASAQPAEPPDAAAPPKPRRRALKLLAVVLGTVLVVGVPSAVALYLTLGRSSGDQLVHMVPANADVYTTVLLDPSLGQKRNLQSFLSHFPATRNPDDIRKGIEKALDSAFEGSGLSYSKDVEPWLGGQLAFAARFGSNVPELAVMGRTNDEGAARRTMQKAERLAGGEGLQWSSTTHGGVAIRKGVSRDVSVGTVWAVFDHAAVITDDEAFMDAVIDADQGRSANLTSSSGYRDTLKALPDDHVAVAYVNAQSAIDALRAPLKSMGSAAADIKGLDAYRSFGAAVSLQSDAAAFDWVTLTDPGKLTDAQRASLTAAPHRPAALGWVPRDSFAVAAGNGPIDTDGLPALLGLLGTSSLVGTQQTSTFTQVSPGLTPNGSVPVVGPDGTLQNLPPQFSVPPPVFSTPPPNPLDELGLTGKHSITQFLSGDSALAVGPGHAAGEPVSAVLVLGVKDENPVDATLGELGKAFNGGHLNESTDGSAILFSMDPLDSGFQPTYAVVDGYAVIGTDPAAVRGAIDAHRGKAADITTQEAFRSSSAAGSRGGLLFVDLQRVMSAVESALSDQDRADYDKNIKSNVAPLRTLVVTSTGDTRQQSVHMELRAAG